MTRLNIPGGVQIVGTRPKKPTFLYHDDFITALAAGSVNGTAAEPGPGKRTLVDTGNLGSIVGGQLSYSGGGGGDGDPTYWTDGFARVAGLAFVVRKVSETFSRVGFDDNQIGILKDGITTNGDFILLEGSGNKSSVGAEVAGTEYTFFFITRTTGYFIVVDGGIYSNKLLWDGIVGNYSPVYGGISSLNAAFVTEYARVAQLPFPWNQDDGIATDTLDGVRSAGDTYTHAADCSIPFEVTTLHSAGNMEVEFRKQGDSNRWRVLIQPDGDLFLFEDSTVRGSSSAGIGNGSIVKIMADDEEIRLYSDSILRITYSLASAYKTETSGEIKTLGTGGSISNLKAFPLAIIGAALNALNSMANV